MVPISRRRLTTILLVFGHFFANIAPSSHAFLLPPLPVSDAGTNKNRHSLPTPPIFQESSKRKVILYSNSSSDDNDVTGVATRGIPLLFVAVLFNIWLFSIPTEFRRARFCSAEQVRLYPDSKCMTTEMWVGGIKNYYANGGGIKFDFSIEGRGDE